MIYKEVQKRMDSTLVDYVLAQLRPYCHSWLTAERGLLSTGPCAAARAMVVSSGVEA